MSPLFNSGVALSYYELETVMRCLAERVNMLPALSPYRFLCELLKMPGMLSLVMMPYGGEYALFRVAAPFRPVHD